MARTFKNVSPFGELLFRSRAVEVGGTVDVDDETAERLLEQPLNWSEVVEESAPKKAPAKSE
jgi:hypothetical protein